MPPSRILYRNIIWYVLDPSMLVPMGAYLFARVRGRYQRPSWLTLFIGIQIFDLIQGLIFQSMAHHGIRNLWFRHLVQPVVMIGMLFTAHQMRPGSTPRTQAYVGLTIAGLAAATAGLFVNGLALRNALFTSTQSIIYLAVSVTEIRYLLLSQDILKIEDKPEFWFFSALLIYASGTLLFNSSSNFFLHTLPPNLILIPWLVVGIVHTFSHLLLAKVFLCPKPTSS